MAEIQKQQKCQDQLAIHYEKARIKLSRLYTTLES